jgi:hypothetical protein
MRGRATTCHSLPIEAAKSWSRASSAPTIALSQMLRTDDGEARVPAPLPERFALTGWPYRGAARIPSFTSPGRTTTTPNSHHNIPIEIHGMVATNTSPSRRAPM